jgi:acyl-ACP thioesterase
MVRPYFFLDFFSHSNSKYLSLIWIQFPKEFLNWKNPIKDKIICKVNQKHPSIGIQHVANSKSNQNTHFIKQNYTSLTHSHAKHNQNKTNV